MDSGLVISSPNACSVTTGGNLWQRKHSTKNIYYASSCASKASQHKRKIQIEYNVLRFQQPSLNHHYKCIERGSTYQECNRKYVVKAIPKPSFDSEPHASHPKNILDSVKTFLATLYSFSYPYAVIGATLSAFSSSFLAVEKLSDISPSFFIGVLQAVVLHVFIGVYISAVNQFFDLEIDKINKPYLPLVSGQLSISTVVITAASFLTLSFWLSWIIGSWPLIWSLGLTFSIWTAYSINGSNVATIGVVAMCLGVMGSIHLDKVPLLRWKRHPLLAAMCMISSWAFVLPITFFLHIQTVVLKRPIVFPRSLTFVVVFMSFYSLGMALAKDIPDVEGDKTHGIDSFSIRLGQKQVFWICVSLFEMAFGVAFLAGVTSSYVWIKIITGLGHATLASIFWYHAKSIDLSNNASTRSFYMLIWKLLYAAHFLNALIR